MAAQEPETWGKVSKRTKNVSFMNRTCHCHGDSPVNKVSKVFACTVMYITSLQLS